MDQKKNKRLVYIALWAALTALVTASLPIPSPVGGFYNIGDSMVMLSALFLGMPGGAIAATIGSALADLVLGYVYFAPYTFIIKGAEALAVGLIAGRAFREGRKFLPRFLLAGIGGIIVMVGGYYIAYVIMTGSMATAAVEVPGNTIQGLLSLAVAAVLAQILQRFLPNLKE